MSSRRLRAELAIGVAVMLGLTAPGAAHAAETFCNPVPLCDWVPRDTGGVPIYNHTDPTKPWVIGQSELVSLSAGEHLVGSIPGAFPIVFVIENGTLEVKDLPEGQWAGFGAWMVLCDQATFRVQNAAFRLYANRDFEHLMFAYGTSRVEYSDARFYTMRPEIEAMGLHGHLVQIMSGSSTLTTAHPLTPAAVNFPNSNGAWELAATQSSNVQVGDMWTMAELYVQGSAALSVSNSFFFDVFFEVCPGDNYSLANLPALCDLRDPVAGCMTTSHASIDFALAPPDTPFELTVVNSKIFSWAISTYEGSSAQVSNVPLHANFAVGVGGVYDDLQLRLVPGATPAYEGFTDRALVFDNVAINGGWMLWPGGSSRVTILPGSIVADVLPGEAAVVTVLSSLLEGAMFMTTPGTGIRLVDTRVNEGASNAGGTLWAVRSSFEKGLHLMGPTYFADTPIPAPFTYDDAASLYQVKLSAPAEGLSTLPAAVPVVGSVRAETSAGLIAPFPLAHLDVVPLQTGIAERLVVIDSVKDDVSLTEWDATDAVPGDYELRLYFVGTDGEQAVAVRRVTILDRCAAVTCTASGPCFEVGVCEHATGSCTQPLKASGASCDDGDACTGADQCNGAGVCAGAVDLCAQDGGPSDGGDPDGGDSDGGDSGDGDSGDGDSDGGDPDDGPGPGDGDGVSDADADLGVGVNATVNGGCACQSAGAGANGMLLCVFVAGLIARARSVRRNAGAPRAAR